MRHCGISPGICIAPRLLHLDIEAAIPPSLALLVFAFFLVFGGLFEMFRKIGRLTLTQAYVEGDILMELRPVRKVPLANALHVLLEGLPFLKLAIDKALPLRPVAEVSTVGFSLVLPTDTSVFARDPVPDALHPS